MPVRYRHHRLLMFSCWFMVVFLVLFPKGGIKLGPVPLTWGYLFFAVSTPVLLLVRLRDMPLRVPRHALTAVALLIPMQTVVVYSLLLYGVADPAFAFATVLGLFMLPWIFLLVYPPFLRWVDGSRLSAYLRWAMLGAALWGIFLFIWHPITGHFIEVPYLTVNAADYGKIETTKHIARGLFFKLISTYNNGNVYGVATLILLPIYDTLEPVRWRRAALKLALLLTLSRTVWFGLLANEALPTVIHLIRQIETFPVLYLAQFRRRLVAIAFTFVMILFSLLLLSGPGLSFLLDPTAGGRVSEVTSIAGVTFFPNSGLGGFTEVVYASALQQLGVSGLIGFILIMASPLFLVLIDRSLLLSPLRRAAFKGLMLYAFLALSDGAFAFIPVMVFYWFAYMIFLFGWPNAHPRSAAISARQPARGVGVQPGLVRS